VRTIKRKISFIIAFAVILLLACSLTGGLKVAYAEAPPSNHRHVSDALENYCGSGGPWGFYQDPQNIEGEPNGNYAQLYTYWYGDTAIIVGEMNDWAIGSIWIYGRTAIDPSYPGWEGKDAMFVYVSESPDGPWETVGSLEFESTQFDWVKMTSKTEPQLPPLPGYAPVPFRYIALVCYSPDDNHHNYIYVDSVAAEPYTQPSPPSPPPIYYPVTVNIRDDSGNPLAGTIYIDGYPVGYTSVTVNLVSYYQLGRPYELFVTVDDSENYVFEYYTADVGGSTTNNPTPIYVTQPATVTAVFSSTSPPPPPPPPSTYSLTVNAVNQYGQAGYVPLYIDGGYVGTTGYSYTVTAGSHQVYVESPLTDGYSYYHVFQYYYYDGNYNYDNPMSLSVTSDKTVTAYYYSYP
jgi:hypothetical protein